MNYKEIGFKCGLEIHQQLDGKKLFCNCPTEIKKGKPDFTFTRKLRASAGESGKVDKAAEHELKKSKIFEYQGYHDTCCLVEMDEEPPHPVNQEALNAALIMAKLLNMKIADSIQFMRKTVIDGSNVSGFQRTALIGYDGYIEVNGRKITVDSLCLEEEAAQVIERTKEKDTYNISRLGIPLLEIATAPEIETPEECKEVAAHIGMLLRSTGKCKRGIGSIRQDVNISIKGGARTEIKGFQEIKSIPLVINKEIERQQKLISTSQHSDSSSAVESGVRKAEADGTTTFLRPMPGADRMYPETDIETIQPAHLKIEVPETLEEKQERYVNKWNLSEDLAKNAVKYESKNNYDFEEDFKKYSSEDLSATIIANTILNTINDVEKKTGKPISFENHKDVVFTNLSTGKITSSSIPVILTDIANTGKLDLSKYEQLSDKEIETTLKKIIKENSNAPRGALIGKAMAEFKGKADGKKVNQILSRLL